jgi:hypothetical protein
LANVIKPNRDDNCRFVRREDLSAGSSRSVCGKDGCPRPLIDFTFDIDHDGDFFEVYFGSDDVAYRVPDDGVFSVSVSDGTAPEFASAAIWLLLIASAVVTRRRIGANHNRT